MASTLYDDQDQDKSVEDRDFFSNHPDLKEMQEADDFDKWENEAGDDTKEKAKELEPEQLESAETDTDENDEADDESKALSASSKEESFVYTAGGKDGDANIARRSKRRRRWLWLSTMLLFPVIGIAVSIILAGPLKLMNIGKMFENFHMGPNQTSSDTTLGRALEFVRTAGANGDKSKRNVGFLAEKISTRQQASLSSKGITVGYDSEAGGRSRRMQSLDIDTSTPQGKKTFEALKSGGFEIPDPDVSTGKTRLSFRPGDGASSNATAKLRRKALNITVDADGKGKIVSALQKRMLRARAGVDFHPIKNAKRALNERFEDWRKKQKDERAERHKEGVQEPATPIDGDSDPGANPDDPDTPNPANDASAGAADEALDEVKKIDAPNADVPGGRLDFIKKLKNSLGGRVAGGAVAVVGVLCMVKSLGNEIPKFQHANVVLPMIRVGYEYVAIASQIQAFMLGVGPPPSLDEMRILSEEVDGIPLQPGEEENPLSIGNSKPFNNAETIEKHNGVANGGVPATKESDVSDLGEKPWIFRGIDAIPGLGAACGLLDGVTGALKKIPIIGWGVSKLEEVQSAIIDGGLKAAFNTSTEEIFGAIISFISGGAIDIRILAGANLGGVADKGVFLGEKEAALSKGGGALSAAQFTALQQDAFERRQYANSQKSFFTRTLDIRDSESLLAQAIIRTPSYRTSDTLYENTASIFGSITSSIGGLTGLFSQKAHAAEPIEIDYGVSPSGFSLEELEDERYADPYANADIIEPQLATLNEQYSGCFGTKIDATTFAMTVESSPDYSKIDAEKCRQGGETLVRYRMYLLQQVTLRSAACYEGLDDQSCKELGVEGGSTSAAGSTTQGGPTTVSAPGLNGYSIPCTGLPATLEVRGSRGDNVDWTGIPDSGTIGTTSTGTPIKVYIREACDQTNVKTVVVGSSIHATENQGQPVSFQLLFKKDLPANMRVIAIPEINADRTNASGSGRLNSNGVNLNRNFNYLQNTMGTEELTPGLSSMNYRGTAPESELETKAVVGFLTSLGDTVSTLIVYHDNLNYVGAAGNTNGAIATKYRDSLREGGVTMALGNSGGVNIRQKGSLDGWYNQATGKPTILVEMPNSSNGVQIGAHADAIINLVRNGDI